MKRRTLLQGVAGSGIAATVGCLAASEDNPGTQDDPAVDPEFELVDAEHAPEDPPEVTVDDDTVTVRGTVQYASSSCGTVDLAHANYEESQARLDLLVVAADGEDAGEECTDDLVTSGYRIEVVADGDLRRIAATEHHGFGETYSSTVDLTDW